MFPNHLNEQAGLDLPAPNTPQESLGVGQEVPSTGMPHSPEIFTTSADAQPPITPTSTQPLSPVLVNSFGSTQTTTAQSDGTTVPQATDDNDEDTTKQHITEVREVIRRTVHDPAAQTIEVNHVKAIYLKRRFNKELAVRE